MVRLYYCVAFQGDPFPISQSPLCSFQDVSIHQTYFCWFISLPTPLPPTQFLIISPSDLDCFFPCRPLEPEWSSSMSLKTLQGKYSAWYVVPLSKIIICAFILHHDGVITTSWRRDSLVYGFMGLVAHVLCWKSPQGKHGHTTSHWSIA